MHMKHRYAVPITQEEDVKTPETDKKAKDLHATFGNYEIAKFAGLLEHTKAIEAQRDKARTEVEKLKALAKDLQAALQETDHHLGYANFPGWVRDEASIAINKFKLACPDL